MVTEVTDQEPVLVIGEKKYVLNDLSEEAKTCVVQLQNVQAQMNDTAARFEQLQMAYNGFDTKLRVLVEEPDTETAN